MQDVCGKDAVIIIQWRPEDKNDIGQWNNGYDFQKGLQGTRRGRGSMANMLKL
jgi:hypothetical protein